MKCFPLVFCHTQRSLPSSLAIRGITQQLMETDAETQSQTLGRAWGSLQKRGERIIGAKGVKDTTRKPIESTNLGS